MIYLGQNVANFGNALVTYDGNSNQNVILQMPVPIQDYLNVVVTSCNSIWDIDGHTNIEVMGREIRSGCTIDVQGTAISDADLVVNFEIDRLCQNGYTVTLEEGVLRIGSATITFGTPFKIIELIMSPCDDNVNIIKTYDDTEEVIIIGGSGSDVIELGAVNTKFEDQIHSDIIIESVPGSHYEIIVNDEGSNESKNIIVRPSGLTGFHEFDNRTIAFPPFGVDEATLRIGEGTMLNVENTAKDVALRIDSSSGNNVSDLYVGPVVCAHEAYILTMSCSAPITCYSYSITMSRIPKETSYLSVAHNKLLTLILPISRAMLELIA